MTVGTASGKSSSGVTTLWEKCKTSVVDGEISCKMLHRSIKKKNDIIPGMTFYKALPKPKYFLPHFFFAIYVHARFFFAARVVLLGAGGYPHLPSHSQIKKNSSNFCYAVHRHPNKHSTNP